MATAEHKEELSSGSGTPRQIAANTLWGSGGRIIGGALALITSALLFRALGPDGAGVYATVLAFFYLSNALADGGLYNVLLRDIARAPRDSSRLVSLAVTLRAVALVAAMALGTVLFLLVPKYDNFSPLIPFAIIFYAALSFAQIFMAVFQHRLVVALATRAEITARAVQLLATAALFTSGTQSVAVFLGVLAGSAILQTSLLYRTVRSFVRVRLRATKREAAAMLRESAPVAVGLLFTLIYFRLDAVLLSLLKSPSDVGIYSLAYKVLEQLIFFPAMFLGVLTPVLSQAFVANLEQFRVMFQRAAGIIAMGALPVFVGGLFLAGPAATLLGGKEFADAANPLRPLLLAALFIFFGTLLGAAVIIAGRQRQAVPIYALGMVVNLVGNILFIPPYSYMGAAWATVATEAVIDVGLIAILASIGIRFTIPKFPRILGATVVMALPLAFFANPIIAALGVWSLVPFLFFCPIIYFASLAALKAFTRDDLRLLRRSSE